MTHTFKTGIKVAALGLIGIAALLAVTVSTIVSAEGLSTSHKVKKAVTCLVFARAQSLPTSTTDVYLHRIGKDAKNLGTVYWMGYATGSIDAYGFSNARKFGSMELARIDAATQLYKLIGCTINEKI